MADFTQLPANLPIPQDDGAAAHLIGMRIPSIALTSTSGGDVNPGELSGTSLIYCYPMTGRPDTPLPQGWDDIPGARGCTPQSCAYRDCHHELTALGVTVFGLSSQTTDYQSEMASRLHLPFAVLSDAGLVLQKALNLPTFETSGMTLLKRLTIIVVDGVIQAVHYPVFPSDSDPTWALATLKNGAPSN